MVNVTFNECNFSSEDDNLEVPDEIDYSKYAGKQFKTIGPSSKQVTQKKPEYMKPSEQKPPTPLTKKKKKKVTN